MKKVKKNSMNFISTNLEKLSHLGFNYIFAKVASTYTNLIFLNFEKKLDYPFMILI